MISPKGVKPLFEKKLKYNIHSSHAGQSKEELLNNLSHIFSGKRDIYKKL